MTNYILETLVVTDNDEDAIYNAIRELKLTMIQGTGLIPVMFIRVCAAVFSYILPYIYKLILDNRKFCILWKLSYTKKRSVNSASNFHPITIIPNFL